MANNIYLADGISLKSCRIDLGLEAAIYRTSFDLHPTFELAEHTIKIPVDITGLNAKPGQWIALELIKAIDFLIVTIGDLLAVRPTHEPREGQIVIVKIADQVCIKRLLFREGGVVLRAFDGTAEVLLPPTAMEVRGSIEGICLEGCWYKIITSSKFTPH
jgi:hypothetical protein